MEGRFAGSALALDLPYGDQRAWPEEVVEPEDRTREAGLEIAGEWRMKTPVVPMEAGIASLPTEDISFDMSSELEGHIRESFLNPEVIRKADEDLPPVPRAVPPEDDDQMFAMFERMDNLTMLTAFAVDEPGIRLTEINQIFLVVKKIEFLDTKMGKTQTIVARVITTRKPR